ncbi:hypothetical protein L210DRAFT_3585952 [Boletus edulis BED1]|uniref:Uncharacterized protein n=1 Tax=Boletus edulis BED1 TaxID=1328754 RepID=A0AAD4BAP9_BOLED|nr:hypothetical protein L210DRAFT_3585952 [Boletus edulis BED1]
MVKETTLLLSVFPTHSDALDPCNVVSGQSVVCDARTRPSGSPVNGTMMCLNVHPVHHMHMAWRIAHAVSWYWRCSGSAQGCNTNDDSPVQQVNVHRC